TPGADARKVKGNIHWLAVAEAQPAEVRLYDRLFGVPFPGARNPHGDAQPAIAGAAGSVGAGGAGGDVAERSYLDDLNAHSKHVVRAWVEPALVAASRETRVQFERHGYFVADLRDHGPSTPVWNRAVTLKDPWGKPPAAR
ncbi:MAG: hypothetical protein ABI190_02570, partial [Casimicrobiaceae bacterium]